MSSATRTQVATTEQIHHGAERKPDDSALDSSSVRAQLRSTPDVVAAYDMALRCIHVSDAVARNGFGRLPDDIVGRMLCDIAPDVAGTLEPLLRHVLETDEPLLGVELGGEAPSGSCRPSRWLGDIYPLRNSVGQTLGVAVLGMDAKPGRRADDRQAELTVRARWAEQRLAFLAEVSQLLASSLDYRATLRHVAHLAVPVLGEWCAVHALEDGRIHLVAYAEAGSTDEGQARALPKAYVIDAQGPPSEVARVLQTGTSLRMGGQGRHSCMVVALQIGGRVFGTLSFGGRGKRRYGAEDVALAEDLARLCARVVDNAHPNTQAERRLRELDALYRADTALHQSIRLDEVLEALARVATDILEADKSAVLLWDSKHEQLVLGAARGFRAETIPLIFFGSGEGITGRAAAHGEPIAVYDLSSDSRVSARMRPIVKAEMIRSLVSVPIKLSDEMVGVFNVIFTVRRILSVDDQRLLLALAQRAALAIHNARLYERAQQAIHAREEFLAATSHELRNPLGNIKGFVSTLQRADVDWPESTRRDFLSEIEREADRMRQFVDDLLDIARIDGVGGDKRTRAPVTLSALVAAGIDRVRHMLAGREVFVRIPGELPALEVDADRLEQVVANLLENAAKYTPEGTPIHVIGRLVGDEVELAVEDEGPGIAAQYLERIFERFFRARPAGEVPGTGLGLAICRAVVQAEGGSIWAENQPSGGARFVVTLPLTY
jgi:signal transduction histidine kinase